MITVVYPNVARAWTLERVSAGVGCDFRLLLSLRRASARVGHARRTVSRLRECAAWPLRGGPSSSGKHARGGPPVDDRGCNDRNKRERRAARDCRDTRAAASGAVSV